MTKLEAIDALIKTATKEEGYLEKAAIKYQTYGASALYPFTTHAGSDNYTKYGYEMHKVYPSVMKEEIRSSLGILQESAILVS